jgi:hypothetical protein
MKKCVHAALLEQPEPSARFTVRANPTNGHEARIIGDLKFGKSRNLSKRGRWRFSAALKNLKRNRSRFGWLNGVSRASTGVAQPPPNIVILSLPKDLQSGSGIYGRAWSENNAISRQ